MNPRDIQTALSDLHWPVATAEGPPEQGTVQLWCGVLRCGPEALAGFEQLLSDEEAQRASRFRTGELRHRFVVSRGILRVVLGGCLRMPADRVRFVSDANGKPRLADDGTIEFNLAHTGDLMVLAVTRGVPVGVDVERVRRLNDARGIARRFFTTRESDWLGGKEGEELDQAFFSLWTRKEALLKATSEGISSGLETIELLDARGEFLSSVSHGNDATTWTLHVLRPAAGFVGVIAVPSGAGLVQLQSAAFRPG